ncbi:MAG: hypothetical protein E6K13_08345 [Methanobacteriota archaeon]|nr:MAG: hypothetical protein E6K13_08345 [Euryarchaeota archaeon]
MWRPRDVCVRHGVPPIGMKCESDDPTSLVLSAEGTDLASGRAGTPWGRNRMSRSGRGVSALAITVFLGLVVLAMVPAAQAATPPTRPLALQSAAGDAAVTLSWLAPSNDGGSPITAYKVYRGTIAGAETLLVTLADVRTYFDSGLINGRTYWYQVSAVNAVGDGILSNEVSATPPQVVGIRWVRQFGAVTSVDDFALGVAVGASSVYVAGYTFGTLPGQTNAGLEDAFLQKHDADGNVTWTRQFGTIQGDAAVATAVDANGVYVAGRTFGTLPGQTGAGGWDAFLQRYDTNGNVQWTSQFGSSGEERATAIATDASAVYITGWTTGALPGQTRLGSTDAFLLKYDTNGNIQWTRQLGTPQSDDSYGIGVDASGVYVAGETCGTMPGETAVGGCDAYIRKYDTAGGLMWTRQLGTPQEDKATGVAVDASGVYIAGRTAGTFPGETSAGNWDAFLGKYDADGAVLWIRQFGTGSYEVLNGVAVDATGVYVAGWTQGTFRGQTSAGADDVFLRKYDGASNIIWTRQFGTAGYDDSCNGAFALCGYIALDASGVYYAGSTSGTFPGQTNTGRTDAFLASLTQIPAEPPGPPTNVQAAAGDGTVDLTWYQPASDGRSPVTNYRIYRGTSSGSLTLLSEIGTTLSYADTGRTNGITYYYAVSAVNAAGEGARSGEVSATPMGTGTVPSAVQSLQAVAGDAQVTLTWQAPASSGSSAVTGYKVYRGTTSGSEALLASVGTVLTYVDTGATNGQIYYYQASALNGVGEGPKSNEASATPAAGTAPSAVQNLQAVAGNARVTLTWQAPASGGSSAITGYNVYRGTAAGAGSLLTTVGTALTYTDNAATNGVTYYYRVSAVNAVGEGPKSNEASATPTATDSILPTIAIGAPANNSALTSTTVTVTGIASDNVAVQKVELSTDGTTWTVAAGTTSWSGTVTLHAGSNVIYARATDTSGNVATAQITVTLGTAGTNPPGLDLILLTVILAAIILVLVVGVIAFGMRSRRERKERPPPPPSSPPR